MKYQIIVKVAIILFSALPFCVNAANVVDDAANGISNAATKVGNAVESAGETVGTAASDTAITTAVKAKIALESDIPMGLSVTTNNGVVNISGKVDTRLQANRVVELAASVGGVTDVNVSKLKISNSDSFFSDAMITSKAKGKIMQLGESGKIGKYDLHVETTNGEVHIFGKVSNRSDVNAIKSAVDRVSGVKSVNTNIDVD